MSEPMTPERFRTLVKTCEVCPMSVSTKYLRETLDEIDRLRAENARLKRHIELRDHAAEDERECRRCGMVFCECPGGKR